MTNKIKAWTTFGPGSFQGPPEPLASSLQADICFAARRIMRSVVALHD